MAGRRPMVRFPYMVALILALGGGAVWHAAHPNVAGPVSVPQPIKVPRATKPSPGTIVRVIESRHFTAAEVTTAARQTQGASFAVSPRGLTRVLMEYRSSDQDNRIISEYARAYIPDRAELAPILAMAPGTTGIGDQCAASLEQPAVHNWANYESHLMAYASRGYVGVITDYEGMRDPERIHHYMVGDLEGRAVLDSIRALKRLPQATKAINPKTIFAAGYSQGGHSVLWADKLTATYAPDVKLSGVIGWGPVMSVGQTWQGVTTGSTLNWFGPYVLTSYADRYQQQYHTDTILLPQWNQNLQSDVVAHCIDSNIGHWGTAPDKVYTPQFLADLKTGVLPEERYGSLQQDLDANRIDTSETATPKLINQGQRDNVVLPSQAAMGVSALCTIDRSPVKLTPYANATHYNVMRDSFNDTLAWMQLIQNRTTPPTSCQH